AALHVVLRQRDRARRDLRRVLRGDPLHGERDDLLCLAVGVALRIVADLADPVPGVGQRLFLETTDQLRLGVRGREPGELLEPAALLAAQAVELGLAVVELLLPAPELAGALAEIALLVVHELELLVRLLLAVDNALLLALHFLAALAGLGLPGLAYAHH